MRQRAQPVDPVTRPKKPAAPVATKKPSAPAPAKTPPLSVASKQPKPQKPPKPAAIAAKPAQTVSAQTGASPTKPAKPKTTKLKTATKPAPSGREKPAPKSVAKRRESAKAAAAPRKRKTAPPAQPKPALSKLEVSQRRALKNKAFSKSRGLLLWPAAADMRRTGRKRDPGITFFTEPYARVISPCYGVVRHVGAFGSGEKIVIIEPQKGYSILISGLAAVDLRKGQKVAAGQPIGRMGGPEQWREEFLIEGRTGAMKRSEKLDLEIYRKERSLNAAAWFRPATERVSGL